MRTIFASKCSRVNMNVTHRLFTHRLYVRKMGFDAAGHPNPFWSRNPPDTRGAGDQSRRGGGAVSSSPYLLQWDRTRCSERLIGEYREDCTWPEGESAGTVQARLTSCVATARISPNWCNRCIFL